MYRRLMSAILAFFMALQLCAMTSYAAEVPSVKKDTAANDYESYYQELEGAEEEGTDAGTESAAVSDTEAEDMTEAQVQDEAGDETQTVSDTENGIVTENGTGKASGTQIMPPISDDCEEETEAFEEGDPEYLFQAGGFKVLNEEDGFESAISLFSTGNMDELAGKMYTALKSRAQSIEIKNYGFYWDNTGDRSQLLTLYYAVINDHPDLYYARTGYGVSYNTKTKLISKITPNYFTNVDDNAFQAGVSKAKSAVSADMDDLQKAIAVHDYLVLNCEYDKERLENKLIPQESYGAYGALANRIAVCQGYALAYKYLMNEYGIECYIVTSDKMNHAWNIVRIGGELYQVDTTWDDPTWDRYGLVSHSNMFLSDNEFGKNHRDWYVTKGSGIVDISAEGTKYDNAFWRDVKSPLVYDSSGTRRYYYVSGDKKLQSRVCSITQTAAEPVMLMSLDTLNSGLALDGTKLYYNTNKNICYIDISKGSGGSYEEQVIFSLKDGDTDNIYGFTKNDKVIRYAKRAGITASANSPTYILNESGDIVSEGERKSYTVTFQDDFGTVFDTQTVSEGGYAIPPDQKMTPQAGYQFSAWKGNYSNIQKDETVTAIYKKYTYTIKYELNGGTNNSQNPSKYDVETEDIILEEPVKREDYVFVGWYEEPDFKTKVTTIEKGSIGNLTLYAKWEPEKYSITYELGGGKNSSLNKTEYDMETETFHFENPTKKGYVFEGWYAEPDYRTIVTAIEKGSRGARTIYAKWKILEYELEYVLDGGTNNEENPAKYNIETDTIHLKDPAQEDWHYVFEGWYTDKDFTHKISEIESGSVGNLCLYAKWTKYYNVRFLDASGKPIAELKVEEGKDASAPMADAPEGYQFVKWDKDYTDVRDDLDIMAVYEAVQYSITYVLGGGTNSTKNPDTYTIETDGFRFAAPKHKNQELAFAGWYRDKNYKERMTSITKGSTGDITLYARWKSVSKEDTLGGAHTEETAANDTKASYTKAAQTENKDSSTVTDTADISAEIITDDKEPAVADTGSDSVGSTPADKETGKASLTGTGITDTAAADMGTEAMTVGENGGQDPDDLVSDNRQSLNDRQEFAVSGTPIPASEEEKGVSYLALLAAAFVLVVIIGGILWIYVHKKRNEDRTRQ